MDSNWMAAAGLLLQSYNEKVREIREKEKKIKSLEEENEALKASQEEIPPKDSLNFEGFLEDIMIKKRNEMIMQVVSTFKTQKPDLAKFDNLLNNYYEYRFGNISKINKLKTKLEKFDKFLDENELTFDNKPFEIDKIKEEIVNNEITKSKAEVDIESLKNIVNQKDILQKKAAKKMIRSEKSIFSNLHKNKNKKLRNKYYNYFNDYNKTDSELRRITSQKNNAINEIKYLKNKLQKVELMKNNGTYSQLIDIVDKLLFEKLIILNLFPFWMSRNHFI